MPVGARLLKFVSITLTVFMLLAVQVIPAVAQEDTLTMENLYYSIWPEYDTPDVLVIYSGTFVNNTGKTFSKNHELRYYMPKGAKVNMVCETENGMLCQRYVIKKDNPDYDIVVWKPSHDIEPGATFPVMFEYNYNQFTAAGERSFVNNFKPAFPITNLTVEVKQPLRSEGFTLDPQPLTEAPDADGFVNHTYQFSDLTEEDELVFNVSYTKADNRPSIEKDQDASSVNETQTAGGGQGLDTTVLILLIAFMGILAVFLVFALKGRPALGNTRSSSRPARSVGTGKSKSKGRQHNRADRQKLMDEKRKIRKMLLDGKISEDTYHQLIEELEEEMS